MDLPYSIIQAICNMPREYLWGWLQVFCPEAKRGRLAANLRDMVEVLLPPNLPILDDLVLPRPPPPFRR
jgi:hypothetical protein